MNFSQATSGQIEEKWQALAYFLNSQGRAFSAATSKFELNEEIDRFHRIFNQEQASTGKGRSIQSFEVQEHSTPKLIAEFIAGVAKRRKPHSILDPTCGLGYLLAATTASAETTQRPHGIEINHKSAEIASKIWEGGIEVFHAEALSWLSKNDEKYDMIISDPPFNLRINNISIATSKGKYEPKDFATALILSSLSHLKNDGTGIFVVPPSFLLMNRREKFLKSLEEAGFRLYGCVHCPSGTRKNTSIPTYIILIDRGEQGDVFIAQLKNESNHLNYLLANLYRKKPKGDISLGRLCSLSNFESYENHEAKEKLDRLAREWGWNAYHGSDIIKRYEVSRSGSPQRKYSLAENSSSLYFKVIGLPQARRHGEEYSKSSEIAHILLDTDIVEPAFLEYWFNESLIGKLTLRSVQTGQAIQRTQISSLIDSKIYLPPRDQQRCVCDGWSYLQRVRSEIDELESSLSNWTESPSKLLPHIRAINQEDRYEDWLESLPFPLASILWRHYASKDSYRERYHMLLHFFEATAAFSATVHLSAYMSNDNEWDRIVEDLSSKLTTQGLSLERATFGCWKLIAERLSSESASTLKKADGENDEANILKQMYGTADMQVLEMLSHKKLLSALQKANKIRNDNLGHSGAIGDDVAKQIHEELMDLVYQLRSVFGRLWNRFELLQPGSIHYRSGIYHISCKRVVGTRSAPFEEREYESIIPLEADCLYLFDSVSRTGLKLQPFVEVIPSPERQAMACFIFNRIDKSSTRWVSYHFDQESEISHPSSGVLSALSRLNSFKADEGLS